MDRRHQSQNLFRTKTNPPLKAFQRLSILICGLPVIFLTGCSMAPKSFLSMSDPAAINRARAVSFGRSEPDSAAIPVLISRLTDDDPVVRLASHEALKKRTGQDFGYLPYAEGDELNTSVSRWQQWWASGQNGRMFATSQPLASPQASAGLSPRQCGGTEFGGFPLLYRLHCRSPIGRGGIEAALCGGGQPPALAGGDDGH